MQSSSSTAILPPKLTHSPCSLPFSYHYAGENCSGIPDNQPHWPPAGPMRYTAGTLWELAICARRQWAFGGSPWLPNYEQRMRENRRSDWLKAEA